MTFLGHWLVTILLLVPAAGAVVTAVLWKAAGARWVALSAMLLAFVLSLLALIPVKWRQAAASGQAPSRAPLIPAMHLEYEAGIDGLSSPFVLLTTALFPLLCVISWNAQARSTKWLVMVLGLEFAILGAFVSFNFLLLDLFLAGVIGGAMLLLREGGERAAYRGFGVCLAVGLCFLIVGSIGMVPGVKSSGWMALATFGFLIWMAIVPFHVWLPMVLSRASTPAAIAIGVLIPAIGGYGLFRAAATFGQAGAAYSGTLAALGIVSILHGGLCTMTQTSIPRFIAYATTLVMGFVLLGFAVRTPVASAGAIFLLLSQGLVVTLLFYARDFAVEDSSALFGVGWLAWLVAPGMLGQVIVLLGTFQAGRTTPAAYGLAVTASFGVLLSGAGAARFIYRRRFQPPVL